MNVCLLNPELPPFFYIMRLQKNQDFKVLKSKKWADTFRRVCTFWYSSQTFMDSMVSKPSLYHELYVLSTW